MSYTQQATAHLCPQCGAGTVVFVIDTLSAYRADLHWNHTCGYVRRFQLGICREESAHITQTDVFDDLERLYRVDERQGTLAPQAAAPQAQAAE